MSDPSAPGQEPLDHHGLLPFEDPNPQRAAPRRGAAPFLYIGQGLTADEFTAYVQSYNFGKEPPDYVVLHHTAVPSTLHTRLPDGDVWDAGETGLSEAQIKARRQDKIAGLRNYYRDTLGWDRGPHLYVDDRYIWLFTPMYDEGVHAMWGNAFHDSQGTYHYSIGIEVVGYYEKQTWPPEVARLVGHAVAVLKRRLGTFELRYLYPGGSPGRVAAGTDKNGNTIWACAHPDRLRAGGITSHRDFNKPQCPGAAITESFYVDVLTAAWQRLTGPAPTPEPAPPQPPAGHYVVAVATANVRQGPGTSFPIALGGSADLAGGTPVEIDSTSSGENVGGNPWWGHLTGGLGFVAMALLEPAHPTTGYTVDSPLLGAPGTSLDRCQRYLVAQHTAHNVGPAPSSYTDDDVRFIARLYFETGGPLGLDPVLAIAQMAHETAFLTSEWSQPPRRNPAGIGVTGEPGVGISFPNWTAAVHAHTGRLLAYALKAGSGTPSQQALIAEALSWRPMPDDLRGSAGTLAGLTGHWATDPQYAPKVAAIGAAILASN